MALLSGVNMLEFKSLGCLWDKSSCSRQIVACKILTVK